MSLACFGSGECMEITTSGEVDACFAMDDGGGRIASSRIDAIKKSTRLSKPPHPLPGMLKEGP